MQLKPSPSQNGVLTSLVPAKGPALASNLGVGEGGAISGRSEFARMLEMQAQNAKLTVAPVSGSQAFKLQPSNASAAAPGPASKTEQANGQSDATRQPEPSARAQAQESQTSSSQSSESRRLVQKQAERSRLQALSDSRASAARGAAPPNAKTVSNQKAAPDKAPEGQLHKSASDEVDKSADAAGQPEALHAAMPPWLTANSADMTLKGGSAASQDVADDANPELQAHGAPGLPAAMALHAELDPSQKPSGAADLLTPSAHASFGATLAGGRQTASPTMGAAKLGQRGSAEVSATKAPDAAPLSNLLSGKLEQGPASRGGAEIASLMPSVAEQGARSSSSEKANGQDFALLLAGQNQTVAADQTAPVPVELSTPVQSPEFREHLGAQVSLLAKEGVQAAELHLNPADMGPISVQITLDGTQARVDFGADSATTRQLIESGLPELASAMREAGLTLSGGGVSQHARGRSEQERSGDQRSRGNGLEPVADVGPSTNVVTRRVALGGVDVFA